MKLRSIICVSAVAAVASASALTSTNTFARLPVIGNTFENALIAIPLAGCGEANAEIYVTNLVMTSNLKAGDKVQLVGFGTFESKVRPARTARNPRTGEEIKIDASKTAAFKVGKALKDSLN